MAQSIKPIAQFVGPVGQTVTAAFAGGRLVSDSGLPWLVGADQALGPSHDAVAV